MRRDARRAEGLGLARDGRITLRRALGIAAAIAAGWLIAAGPLGMALPGSPAGVSAAMPMPMPTPTPTAAPSPFGISSYTLTPR